VSNLIVGTNTLSLIRAGERVLYHMGVRHVWTSGRFGERASRMCVRCNRRDTARLDWLSPSVADAICCPGTQIMALVAIRQPERMDYSDRCVNVRTTLVPVPGASSQNADPVTRRSPVKPPLHLHRARRRRVCKKCRRLYRALWKSKASARLKRFSWRYTSSWNRNHRACKKC